MNLSVLYRGPLASCNYDCHYCPFAKRAETRPQLERDRQGITRFVAWLENESQHSWKILFTPWGEALTRVWYREALIRLTRATHIESVAIQTNLSCRFDWLQACRADRVAFWATFHPTETRIEKFLSKVQTVRACGARISVGMVAMPELVEEILAMRRVLPKDVYLWINAQQPRPRPYTAREIATFRSIDPQFELTLRRQKSFGRFCQAGEVSFSVDGVGNMRRCHFVDEVIGNIHHPDWAQTLRPRSCPKRYCDCFLGKAQLQVASLGSFFGSTMLERLAVPSFSFDSSTGGD